MPIQRMPKPRGPQPIPTKCEESEWHDPPFCGNPTCRHRPPPHCDNRHDEPRCTDPDCHLICRRVRHPKQYHGYGICRDPNCVDPRGFDQYRDSVKAATTIKKVWNALSSVISHGPPGDDNHARDTQRRRFHREMVALKRELAELMKPRVLEFIERWRTSHMPGEE